ncbi:MAG: single-stranded DNA-binding protein [Armatimonadota bacterium]
MLNRVVLIGRLATDPELKYTPSGLAVATFRIAVDRNRPGPNGEREADFIPIVAWKQSAEFAANYLTKGRLVAVDGRMQVRSWVAQDGTKRYVTEVVAENLRGLDRPKEQTEAATTDETTAGSGDTGTQFDDPFADE